MPYRMTRVIEKKERVSGYWPIFNGIYLYDIYNGAKYREDF
jgi:hypothetical protein